MSPIELLRFGWKPNEFRILLAALVDAGPVSRRVWLVRTQIPRSDHFENAMAEVVRLGGVRIETRAEGLCVFVLPPTFWRAKPLADETEWRAAWRGVAGEQVRMELPTEMPSLAETMAVGIDQGATESRHTIPGFREGGAEKFPDFGKDFPDFGNHVKRLNDLTVDRSPLAFNVERLKAPGFREGWIEPDSEEEAQAACRRLLGDEEMRQWGGMWRNRWRRNPDGVRKVLNMVREDQSTGRKPSRDTWGRYATFLWNKFVEAKEVAK